MSLFAKKSEPIGLNPNAPLCEPPVASKVDEKKLPDVSFVEDLCLCQVCYMKFNETTKMARILNCGHTFCAQCIETVQKYGNSAHTECPTCRTETKCAVHEMTPNYLIMEFVRKFGFMGPAVAVEPAQKKAKRADQRKQTVSEMIDECYRQLIATVKAELMQKFEDLKENSSRITLTAVHRELQDMYESVETAVLDAYDGYSESDNDLDDDDDDEEEDDKLSSMNSSIEAARDEQNHEMIELPVNPNRSDIEFESSGSDETSTSSSCSSSGSTSSSSSDSSYTSGESV